MVLNHFLSLVPADAAAHLGVSSLPLSPALCSLHGHIERLTLRCSRGPLETEERGGEECNGGGASRIANRFALDRRLAVGSGPIIRTTATDPSHHRNRVNLNPSTQRGNEGGGEQAMASPGLFPPRTEAARGARRRGQGHELGPGSIFHISRTSECLSVAQLEVEAMQSSGWPNALHHGETSIPKADQSPEASRPVKDTDEGSARQRRFL
ncbi:hypothetical protein B0T25DRAFT_90790 [Lasiosphaeria hispida]|uniref:Uncharacterized protein n=1 Tax=Lasiosphaeria hispida TaxID=260671 RepID=A0AAJ0MHG6_9PEZI|nr:hypothetical protein B0T25DRAFT_90790 [Lasiosphaeria hispida]